VKSDLLLTPNQITLMRFVFVPFIIICVLDGHWRAALVLFVIAGISDGLDGLAARMLHQRTLLGEYLDPIADKLLLSGLFLVLSMVHRIPWRYTVMVFSRDICIVATAALLYTAADYRNFRPSFLGKANTAAQVAALFFVLLHAVAGGLWVDSVRRSLLWLAFALALLSGIHYILLTGQRMKRGETR
jgi:cardiolipin synthase